MNWNGKKVLVTGGGGFIGSHLVEHLVELGATTRAFVHYNSIGSRGWLEASPVRDQVEVFPGDIADHDRVFHAVKGVDYVFHLAAMIAIPYSYSAQESFVRTNIIGTLNVLQSARDLGTARVLQTSTSEVYGTALRVPIDEDHPLQGQSPYSATKIGADKMVESFYRSFDLPVVTVRPFNTFGPRQSARAVIPTIICQCLAGKKEISLGNLTPTRDMNFVRNIVEGFVAAAESDQAIGQTINFGSGRDISIGDLANLIVELTGSDAVITSEEQRLRPEKSEVERLLADNTRAKQLTGWTPRITLEEGLQRTIDWLRVNQDKFRPYEYTV